MNKIILKYFDKNDELECGDCDWWGDPEQLHIRNKRPVCPKCGSEDVFDVTKNMGKLLLSLLVIGGLSNLLIM